MPSRPPRLRGPYAITPDLADSGRLCGLVEAALRGGIRFVQYRNKEADAALAAKQAKVLLALTRRYHAYLIVNDDAELALNIGADGVHLGREDGGAPSLASSLAFSYMEVRNRAPTGFLIGASCYNELPRAREAAAAGADYLAFGSVFASSTKPQAVRADLALLAAAKTEFRQPIVAIGGVSLKNAPQLTVLGVDAIAVISSLFGADDVETEARSLCRLFPADEHP